MNTQSRGTIAVFDALDVQGGAVVDSLLSRGARVRGLVRDLGSERAQSLAGRGVELARVEVDDAASLRAALQGVGAFFFMTTMEGGTHDVDGETRQGVALIDAAVAAAVPNVVFSSVGGADRDSGVPLFESKRHLEERLEKQTMFRWLQETPALQADIEAVKVIEPTVWNLPEWIRSSGWTVPIPAQ